MTHIMRTQYGGFGITELQYISMLTNLTPLFYRDIVNVRILGYSYPEVLTFVIFVV